MNKKKFISTAKDVINLEIKALQKLMYIPIYTDITNIVKPVYDILKTMKTNNINTIYNVLIPSREWTLYHAILKFQVTLIKNST